MNNLEDFYESFFGSSQQEKKGIAMQDLEQGCSDDSLVA